MFATKSYATHGAGDALKDSHSTFVKCRRCSTFVGKRERGRHRDDARDQINSTFDQMLKSDAKYRFVIDVGTLK
ncbi:MAG: hypothetical protein DME86_09725 [Verrucomicrobia bacterium]|nr:MAG: hypothetical protein DME86_09725 [Verrucomicrobiota bacterium]